jgi:hypothetical protein
MQSNFFNEPYFLKLLKFHNKTDKYRQISYIAVASTYPHPLLLPRYLTTVVHLLKYRIQTDITLSLKVNSFPYSSFLMLYILSFLTNAQWYMFNNIINKEEYHLLKNRCSAFSLFLCITFWKTLMTSFALSLMPYSCDVTVFLPMTW